MFSCSVKLTHFVSMQGKWPQVLLVRESAQFSSNRSVVRTLCNSFFVVEYCCNYSNEALLGKSMTKHVASKEWLKGRWFVRKNKACVKIPKFMVWRFWWRLSMHTKSTSLQDILSVEDTGHITIEHHLTNLLFLSFSTFLRPFVHHCFTSTVSSTPSTSQFI